MKIGYAGISTQNPNLNLQIDALRKSGRKKQIYAKQIFKI